MRKLLVVGQTPPPFGGQALMIKYLLDSLSQYENVHHVNMQFSKSLASSGKFEAYKIIELFRIIFGIFYKRFRYGLSTIYYPPTGGGGKLPFYRDSFILILSRVLFKYRVFHFHASGLDDLYPRLNFFEKFLFKLAYSKPDISIIMSQRSIVTPSILKSKRIEIIPNGIKDINISEKNIVQKVSEGFITILFVGLISESKGVLVLINACKILYDKGKKIRVNIAGEFESDEFKSKVMSLVAQYKMGHIFDFKGKIVGNEKVNMFRNTDIFCFPTYFEYENFPLVLIEAMMFSLPIVTTDWRAISDLIVPNENGFLSPIKSPEIIANYLEILIENQELRKEMGAKGRFFYEGKYTNYIFESRMLQVFENI